MGLYYDTIQGCELERFSDFSKRTAVNQFSFVQTGYWLGQRIAVAVAFAAYRRFNVYFAGCGKWRRIANSIGRCNWTGQSSIDSHGPFRA